DVRREELLASDAARDDALLGRHLLRAGAARAPRHRSQPRARDRPRLARRREGAQLPPVRELRAVDHQHVLPASRPAGAGRRGHHRPGAHLRLAERGARRGGRDRPPRVLADRADPHAAEVVSAADHGDGRGAERRHRRVGAAVPREVQDRLHDELAVLHARAGERAAPRRARRDADGSLRRRAARDDSVLWRARAVSARPGDAGARHRHAALADVHHRRRRSHQLHVPRRAADRGPAHARSRRRPARGDGARGRGLRALRAAVPGAVVQLLRLLESAGGAAPAREPIDVTMRAAITGVGAVSGFGRGAERLWAALVEGRRAMRERPELAGVASGPVALVEELPLSAPSRAATMATWAAEEALADAGDPARGARLGVACGTTLGGIAGWLPLVRATMDAVPAAAAAPARWGYAGPAQAVAAAVDARGPLVVPSVACASGNVALGAALDLLRRGRCDVVLAGGADALHDFVLAGFGALKAADVAPCRPFDRNRRG